MAPRGATSVTRRGGGPLPEQNDWAHPHSALQHALSGIAAEQRKQQAPSPDPGPPRSPMAEDLSEDF